MKIAVINNGVPFLWGGAEYLADTLVEQLQRYGHEAVLVRYPFRWDPPERILDAMLACRLMRIPDVDRVIALKFPAYYVPHPNKVLWLLHQFRQAYDFWGTPFQFLPDDDRGREIKRIIAAADNEYLRAARHIYTNSRVTAGRLMKFNGIASDVLYPPLLRTDHLECDSYGDYIFYPSRVNAAKRQHLAVEAMRYVKSAVRLIVAGKSEAAEDTRLIQETIERYGLRQRVTFIDRFISEEEKAELYARALASIYIPYDEDSYGYVTLESYHCLKPVITCTDSGGTGVVVKDGETGFVTPPDPHEIAAAMDRLFEDKSRARSMGEAGQQLVETLGITWDTVVERLTA